MPLELRSRVRPDTSVPSDFRTLTGACTGTRRPERLSDPWIAIGCPGSVPRLANELGTGLTCCHWFGRLSRFVSRSTCCERLFQAGHIGGPQPLSHGPALVNRAGFLVRPHQQNERFRVVLVFFELRNSLLEGALRGQPFSGAAVPAFLDHA